LENKGAKEWNFIISKISSFIEQFRFVNDNVLIFIPLNNDGNRLLPRTLRTPPEDRSRVLKFWFDFSSPWSYLGWSQLERIQRDAGPGLKIVLKPFLLGALFRE
jgi:hypothetical protein